MHFSSINENVRIINSEAHIQSPKVVLENRLIDDKLAWPNGPDDMDGNTDENV